MFYSTCFLNGVIPYGIITEDWVFPFSFIVYEKNKLSLKCVNVRFKIDIL